MRTKKGGPTKAQLRKWDKSVAEIAEIIARSRREQRPRWQKVLDFSALMAYTKRVISNNVKGYAMKPSKTTIETIKTVIIAVLITGIIAFVGGMKYEAHNNQKVESAVKAVQATVAVEAKK